MAVPNAGFLTSPEEHIVDFAVPPVAEVSFGVQFSGPVIDATATLGSFWPRVKDEYQRVELQPPLPPLEESFEVPTPPRIGFAFVAGPEATRYWLVNNSSTELIQVQPDRFGYNWRREPAEQPYPRYVHLRARFAEAFERFLETIQESPREFAPTWCEISYVNPVFLDGPGAPRRDLASILTRLGNQDLTALPKPFNTQLSERFQLERADQPYARFYIEADPSFDPDNRLGYRITLTMRGTPETSDANGVLDFFDDGRRRIVETFRDMTTSEMHERWRLQ